MEKTIHITVSMRGTEKEVANVESRFIALSSCEGVVSLRMKRERDLPVWDVEYVEENQK